MQNLKQVLEKQGGCIFPLKERDLFFRSSRTAVLRKINYLLQLVQKHRFLKYFVAFVLAHLSCYSLETYKHPLCLDALLFPLVVCGKIFSFSTVKNYISELQILK